MRIKTIYCSLFALIACAYSIAIHAAINVVAAENIYGSIAKQLGGPYVDVVSILNNPSQDPHLFSITPSTAKAAANADVIIYNGLDYDPWMNSLLATEGQRNRNVIVIADLMHIKIGSNPHLWYNPDTIPIFAKYFVSVLTQLDPTHKEYFQQQLSKLNLDYQIIYKSIHQLQQNFKNIPVIATEPVFNYMCQSIGLVIYGQGFQINIMNDIPPTVSQIKNFEDLLQQRRVHVLIYNDQVVNPMTNHMLSIANQENIPVVGVSELLPANMTYVQWMLKELNQLRSALENFKETNHASS